MFALARFALCLLCSSSAYSLELAGSEGQCLVQRASSRKTAGHKQAWQVYRESSDHRDRNAAPGVGLIGDTGQIASLSSIEYHPGKDALDTDKDIPEIHWDGTSKKGLPTIQKFALKEGLPGEENHTPGKGRVAGNSLAQSGVISNLMTESELFLKGDSTTAESWDKLASSHHRWIFTSVLVAILIVQLFIVTVYFGSSASKTPGGDDPNDDEEEKQEGETRRLRSGCC